MTRQISALIVDDERLARQELKSMLREFDTVQVVGEADDVPSAMNAIQQLNPDVIFLDIQMPGASGFDLLDKMNIRARIIFVTAYDEYAIRAFEINALDYLLKPVSPHRLRNAIQRLNSEDESVEPEPRKLNYDDYIFLMVDNKMTFLKVNTILCINAAGDYSEILTRADRKGLALKSMKEWEYRLPENYFIRIHRSTIINLEYVDHLEEWFNYSFQVYLKGIPKPVIMSRRYAAKLKEKLG
ncbi:response regulator transcription factor [candidate division KSB1 bacterium]|nr:response regulator transcription factor [candidate division KSB1 bacterium]